MILDDKGNPADVTPAYTEVPRDPFAERMTRGVFLEMKRREIEADNAHWQNQLEIYHWGDAAPSEVAPLSKWARLRYRIGASWYAARESVVRAVAWLLRVSLPQEDE